MIRRTLKKKPSLVKNKTGKRKNTKGIKRNRRKVHKTRKRKGGGEYDLLMLSQQEGEKRLHVRGIIPSLFKKLIKQTVELAKPSWSSFKDVLPTEKNRIREAVVSEVHDILDKKERNVQNRESFVNQNILYFGVLKEVFDLFKETKTIKNDIERKYKRIFYLYFMEGLITKIDEGKEPKETEKELYIEFGQNFNSFKKAFTVTEENPKEKKIKGIIVYYLGKKNETINSRAEGYSSQRPKIITGTASVIQDSDTGSDGETTEITEITDITETLTEPSVEEGEAQEAEAEQEPPEE
jgi:hypothetical protein